MFFLCQLDQFRCRLRCKGHCFFGVNVFSGFQCLTDQPLVGRCRCQNDYHFNRRVCQNFLVGTALDAILLCFLFRMFKMACAACCYLKILKVMNHVRQINITDRSAADNADSHFFRFCCSHLQKSPLLFVFRFCSDKNPYLFYTTKCLKKQAFRLIFHFQNEKTAHGFCRFSASPRTAFFCCLLHAFQRFNHINFS